MRRTALLCWSVLPSALTGCAPGLHVDTTVDPAFVPAEVRSVAVLPWFDWALSVGETRSASDQLAVALLREDTGVRVVSEDEATGVISGAGLAYEWALYVYDRTEEAIPDSTVVMRVGDALGVDLLAHIALLDVVQQDGSQALGPAYTSVLVQVTLYDARTGHVAWSGSSGVAYADDPLRAPPVLVPVGWALDAVFHKLPSLGDVRSR